jgi:hypothetical protein
MKKILLASATVLGLALGAGASIHAADLATQQIALVHVDIAKVTNAIRAGKLIGTPVRNDAKDKIGTVSDLLISHDDKVPYAVIDVGSFLGVGGKLVLVPFDAITVEPDSSGKGQILVVPGATKDALKSLPEFKYSK